MTGTSATTSRRSRARDAQPGRQRPPGTRPASRRLRQRVHHGQGGQHEDQQHDPDQAGRVRRELHQRAAGQRARGQPADRHHAADHGRPARRVRRVEIDQGGAERGQHQPGGDALHRPGQQQHGHVPGQQEQHQGAGFQRDGGRQDQSPAHVVRQFAGHQQRAEQGEHEDREDQRERPGGESPQPLVDDIQRRGGAGRRLEQHHDRDDHGKAGGPRQPAARPFGGRTGRGGQYLGAGHHSHFLVGADRLRRRAGPGCRAG